MVFVLALLGCTSAAPDGTVVRRETPRTLDWSEAPRRVRGILTDSTGRPIIGASIAESFCPSGESSICHDAISTITYSDSSGRFSFEVPQDGHYVVIALVDGIIVSYGRVALPRDAATILQLRATGTRAPRRAA
jgi:hypothetical protein